MVISLIQTLLNEDSMELVRDEVPNILKRKGLNPEYKSIDTKDHARFDLIRSKFLEVSGEAANSIKSGNPEIVLSTMANLMEIMGVAANQYGLTMMEIKNERDKKRKLKGGHSNFYVLINPDKRF